MNNAYNSAGKPVARTASSRRILPWVLAILLLAVGGVVLWANNRVETVSSPNIAAQSGAGEQAAARESAEDQAKQGLIAPQNDIASLQQSVKDLQSSQQRISDQLTELQRQLLSEQGERKLLGDQLGALSSRVNNAFTPKAETPSLVGETERPQGSKKRR